MESNGLVSTIKRFFKKYFAAGQAVNGKEVEEVVLPADATAFDRFLMTRRKLLGMIIPPIFFYAIWLVMAVRYNLWSLFPNRYEMSITMIFGSFVGGITCEGSGAIAFPVMTLLLHIDPTVARDFSLMIQSCGMVSAAFTILFMRIALEWRSIVFCSLGGIFGTIFGFHMVDPYLSNDEKKIGFVSIWFSFAIALYILNRQHKRTTYDKVQHFNWWKALVLLAAGFLGGNFTAFAGSGLDICSFSMLTLLFHVSEKVATPTSVVLMAFNTLVGFFWRNYWMQGIMQAAWEYWAVSVPIAVITAPLGSLVGSHLHRLVLASMIYVLETAALIGGLAIVQPGLALSIASAVIILGGSAFFVIISSVGTALTKHHNDRVHIHELKMSNSRGNFMDLKVNHPTLEQKIVINPAGDGT
uniref:Uncharacterized protein n=1 Tax=Plectus sambesii TaxID=2011161 RepID=A0A914UZV2_9BILA